MFRSESVDSDDDEIQALITPSSESVRLKFRRRNKKSCCSFFTRWVYTYILLIWCNVI